MNPQGHQVGDVTHERKDADVINVAMIVVLLLLVITICLMVCWGILHFLNRQRQAEQTPRARMTRQMVSFAAPQLIQNPGNEWKKTRSQEETELETYGWINRAAGVAHIPIARAMELLVKRGLPNVGAGQTRLQLMQARPRTNQQPERPVTPPASEASP